jgi:large subunit ribosomal protein L7Ae
VSTPKNFGIGQDIQPKRDLTRMVKWPKYVRLQRQRAILKQRIKIPPAINQFTKTIEKPLAMQLFGLMNKYRPETRVEKKARLVEQAAQVAAGKFLPLHPKCILSLATIHVSSLILEEKTLLLFGGKREMLIVFFFG